MHFLSFGSQQLRDEFVTNISATFGHFGILIRLSVGRLKLHRDKVICTNDALLHLFSFACRLLSSSPRTNTNTHFHRYLLFAAQFLTFLSFCDSHDLERFHYERRTTLWTALFHHFTSTTFFASTVRDDFHKMQLQLVYHQSSICSGWMVCFLSLRCSFLSFGVFLANIFLDVNYPFKLIISLITLIISHNL